MLQYRVNRHLQRKTQVLLKPSILSANSLGQLSFATCLYYIHALLAIAAIKINFLGVASHRAGGWERCFKRISTYLLL